MTDGLFKSLYDNYREYRRTLRRHHVSGLIDPDLFDEPFYYIEMVKHCCDMLINPHIKWKMCYPEPSYYQRLAKRMMKCIDEWDYENEIESLEEDIRKRSMEVRPPNDKLTTEAGWNKWKADPLKNLADLYATCPEEKFRNGDKAVSLAHKACELTNYQNSDIVNVLAAAYAECSNFDKAIEYQNKAIKLVEEKDYQIWPEDAERLRDYKEHLAAYKQKKPWRQKST